MINFIIGINFGLLVRKSLGGIISMVIVLLMFVLFFFMDLEDIEKSIMINGGIVIIKVCLCRLKCVVLLI